MQVTGMLHGARMLQFVGFPTTEVLGPSASEEEIRALIDRHGMVFIKPVFKGGVGKKGKAGLIGKATDLKTALKEKERLYFVEHRVGHIFAKANGVTLEAGVPAEHEIYFSITDSTHFRAPTMTLTHHGGMDIEELDKSQIAQVPFDPLTGLKAFVVANALSTLGAPKQIISPLVQHLPKLWELYHDFGMTTLELNPIRMREDKSGRLRVNYSFTNCSPSAANTTCSTSSIACWCKPCSTAAYRAMSIASISMPSLPLCC